MYYDVIIAGSGVAGLHAALSLDKSISVLVLSKKDPLINNTALAQGGVAAVLDPAHDSPRVHFNDTMVAGGNTNDPLAVGVLVEEGPDNVLNLAKLGVEFDKNGRNEFDLTLEGGHSRRRIAHHRDTTGYEIASKLLSAAKSRENITLLDNASLCCLDRDETGFIAGILHHGRPMTACSRFFIMATGGIGRVYRYTTNSPVATGDGILLAHMLGARIFGLSLIQFHPTAFAAGGPQRFLISESVRGEGALLLNCNGRRFMQDYDPRGELAPRDVVSQSMMREEQKTGSSLFYLDITGKAPDFVKKRFPGIYAECLKSGVDITRQWIPVYPCQHYLMGGIDVNTYGRTSAEGLYAVGECAHTGVHGNNRLASNSLLEALVFSKRAAEDIMGRPFSGRRNTGEIFRPRGGKQAPESLRAEIQAIMQQSFFVMPDKPAAKANLPRIDEICDMLENGDFAESAELLEIRSLAFLAQTILKEVIAK